MKEVTFNAEVIGYLGTLQVYEEGRLQELIRELGNGRKVKVTIQYEDPRQDWIDKWYSKAVAAAGETVIFKFVNDGTVCIPMGFPEHTAVAAPCKGDKYDRKTGMAIAFAKTRNEEIPEYI